jgi:hypothetical protein
LRVKASGRPHIINALLLSNDFPNFPWLTHFFCTRAFGVVSVPRKASQDSNANLQYRVTRA